MSRPLNANIDEPRPVSIVQRIEAGHVIGLLLDQELMHVVQHMANLSAKVVDEIVVVIATAQRVASFVLERRLDLFIFGFSKTSVVIDEKYMELAVRALHKAFDLDSGPASA